MSERVIETVPDARLDAIAAGSTPSPAEARAILVRPERRAALAARDPAALFSLLGALPLDPPAPEPVFPARVRLTILRGLLATAATLLAAAGLAGVLRLPGPSARPAALAAAELLAPTVRPDRPLAAWPAPVERVGSPTAEVVTLVPPSEGGAVVTMIVDEGVEL